MSARKTVGATELLPSKKRAVTVKTVEKWIKENERELDTSIWLNFEKVNREYVGALKCSICIRFKDRVCNCRNYDPAFIHGSTNLRCSSFKDHALTDMHKKAMNLFRMAQSQDITAFAPIAREMLTIDADTEARMKKKFDLTYFLCKENLAFKKMSSLCELEERHDVDLGSGYKNNQACTTFLEYIDQDFRERLVNVLDKVKFFSIQADGSTDAGRPILYFIFCLVFQTFSFVIVLTKIILGLLKGF